MEAGHRHPHGNIHIHHTWYHITTYTECCIYIIRYKLLRSLHITRSMINTVIYRRTCKYSGDVHWWSLLRMLSFTIGRNPHWNSWLNAETCCICVVLVVVAGSGWWDDDFGSVASTGINGNHLQISNIVRTDASFGSVIKFLDDVARLEGKHHRCLSTLSIGSRMYLYTGFVSLWGRSSRRKELNVGETKISGDLQK